MQILPFICITLKKDPAANIVIFHVIFPERVDLKDRVRCDGAAEAGLRASESPELLLLAGVLTDMTSSKSTRSHQKLPLSSKCLYMTVPALFVKCVPSRLLLLLHYNKEP